MTHLDTHQILVAGGVVTPDVVQRASTFGPNVAMSRTGKLIAAGVDQARMFDALSQASGIPLATPEMVSWATQVMMLPSTARQMRDLCACPLRRDPTEGTLHIAIADVETLAALDQLLINFKVYLAPEPKVRGLLANLYSVDSSGQAQSVEAIEIDLEASRRNLKAPPTLEAIEIDLEASQRFSRAALQQAAATAKATTPAVQQPPMVVTQDPFGPKSSGSFKRSGMSRDDETMRIQRAPRGPEPSAPPRAPDPAAPPAPASPPPRASSAAASEPAITRTSSATMDGPSSDELALVRKRAFMNGVIVGAAVTAVAAAVVAAIIHAL